jgi:hypothetical protein
MLICISADDQEDGTPSWGRILAQPWFSRMWVIQEVFFARKAIILCGAKELGWDDFLRVALVIEPLGGTDSTTFQKATIKSSSPFFLRLHVHEILAPGQHPETGLDGAEITASNLLLLCQFHSASEPRDKVYALFSLLKQLGVELPDPDYSKSVMTVYREVC